MRRMRRGGPQPVVHPVSPDSHEYSSTPASQRTARPASVARRLVLALAFTTAILVAATVFYTGWDLLGARELKTERRIDSKTLFDLVMLSFGVVAGAGALVALVVAYRRQRVEEDGALREATRLHTERFTTAVSQLGDESAAVRLGGVHALAGLADGAPSRELRQTCIDVLCAYLRLPYTAEVDLPEGDAGARHAYLALWEVRHTIIRLIRDHLRLPPEHLRSWQGHDFDFTGVVFDGGDLSQAVFSGGTVHFDGATFSGSMVNFSRANFIGGTTSSTRRGSPAAGSTLRRRQRFGTAGPGSGAGVPFAERAHPAGDLVPNRLLTPHGRLPAIPSPRSVGPLRFGRRKDHGTAGHHTLDVP